jgi:hypothetical protein
MVELKMDDRGGNVCWLWVYTTEMFALPSLRVILEKKYVLALKVLVLVKPIYRHSL